MAGPPFSIDTANPSPSSLISAYPTNETANRQNILDWLSFLSDPTTGIIKAAALPATVEQFPTGTVMLFRNAAAPTGWTKRTDLNDYALRVVSGTPSSGGTIAFTDMFNAAFVSGSHVLTTAETPSHTHGFSGNTNNNSADHTHGFSGTFTTSADPGHAHTIPAATTASGAGAAPLTGTLNTVFNSNLAGAHTHTVSISGTTSGISAPHFHSYSGTTTATGSGGGHTHSTNMQLKFLDFIIATRN